MQERGWIVSTGLLVPEEAEAQQKRHVALVQQLLPHLARALKVNKQLSAADFRWQAAEQCFDRLEVGVMLLSTDMEVRFANIEAERILREEDGLARDREGRLCAASSSDDIRLRSSVRSMANRQTGQRDSGGILSTRRLSGRRPYRLLIAGVRPPEGLFGWAPPNVILFVSEGRTHQPSSERLALVFGLTPAQSRLLQVLLQGYSLTEAAAKLGKSVNTANTHLRALFHKFDCSRQTDLIRTITAHSVWLAEGRSRR